MAGLVSITALLLILCFPTFMIALRTFLRAEFPIFYSFILLGVVPQFFLLSFLCDKCKTQRDKMRGMPLRLGMTCCYMSMMCVVSLGFLAGVVCVGLYFDQLLPSSWSLTAMFVPVWIYMGCCIAGFFIFWGLFCVSLDDEPREPCINASIFTGSM